MGRYSIKDLEHLSGIKAHTLRVWEQRYNIIEPKRTPTKIRYYDDEDLRLILNISFLNRNGHRISKIAKMESDEIQEAVRRISDSNLEFPNQVNALVIAMVGLDEERFEKIISTNTLQFGFEKTMMQIVYPFLEQIGILWQTGSINPAHEHFISNLIRQKLIVAIDGQISPLEADAKKYALFLPEGELHELSLLFANYVVRSRQAKAIYLGQNLPLKDLGSVCEAYEPDFVFSVITSYPSAEELTAYLVELRRRVGDSQIILTGYQVIQMRDQLPDDIIVVGNLEEFIDLIDSQMNEESQGRGRITSGIRSIG